MPRINSSLCGIHIAVNINDMRNEKLNKFAHYFSLPVVAIALFTAVFIIFTVTSATQSQSVFEEKATESRVLRLEKIVIEGNKHIPSEKIKGSMFLKPGDVVNVEMLEREKQNILRKHPLIELIDMYTLPGSKKGRVILKLNITEKKRFTFETGYGYHETYGWFLTLLGLRIEQPFGTNSYMRTGLKLGFHVSGLEAEWIHNTSLEGGFSYGVRASIYGEDHIFFGNQNKLTIDDAKSTPYTWSASEWRSFEQRISRAGVEVALRYKANSTSFSFGLKTEKVTPDSLFTDIDLEIEKSEESFPEEMRSDLEKVTLSNFFFRVIHDTRNSFIYPIKGSYFILWLKNSNSLLGSEKIYTRLKLEYVQHINLGKYRVLSGRLYAGTVSSGAPYYERFYIGGIYSIRGFKELSLSPTTGDNAFFIANGELRFPLIGTLDGPPRLSGLVFLDAGKGWRWESPYNHEREEKFESSAGYGVRLMLPWLGTLGVDVGIPFTEGRTGDRFFIHGALGFSF